MNSHSHTKFRPLLTLEQITHITSIVSELSDPISVSIKRALIPLIAKIEVGAISPSYKLSQTKIIRDNDRIQRERYENDLMTPEESSEYETKILGI